MEGEYETGDNGFQRLVPSSN